LLVEQVVPLAPLAEGDYELRVRHPSGEGRARVHLDPALPASAVRVVAREGLPAGDGRIRFLRGTQFAKQGKPARAIEEMAEAARLLPRDLEVHLKLAFLLNATAQHQRVVDLLVPLAPHHPTEPDVWIFLGFASQKLGRLAEAVAYYEKAVALRPEDARLKGALEEVRRLRANSSRP
jgi:tetratricopeptide (TPR) repeat protein